MEHSFKHPGVVGRNVLSFNFQSRGFFFFFAPTQLEFKDSLKNGFFLWGGVAGGAGCGGRFVSLRARAKSDKTGGGGRRGQRG